MYVNDSAKFVSIAETLLRQKGRVTDFRNLGFSGGTLADYVQLGPSIIARYHSAKVVIQLTATDFGPESFDTKRVNYFVRESSGSLALRHRNAPVGPPSTGARFKHYLALINYLQMRYLTIAEWRAEHSTVKNTTNDTRGAEVTQDTIVAEMDLLRQAYKTIPVILLILPRVPRIQSGTVVNVDPAHEQFLKIIANSVRGVPGWQIVDPQPGFRDLVQGGDLPRGFLNTRPGSGHLNTSGHRIVGQYLARAIASDRP